MLGDTGTIKRVAAVATVCPGAEDPSDWFVESTDAAGEGSIFTVVFLGPRARERALEYAQEKYSGVQLREDGPQQCR